MLSPAHHGVLARLLANNVPPQPHCASETLSAKKIDILIEALVNIDPDSIPLAQTQNVLGWITSTASYDCTESGAKSHPLDHLINSCVSAIEMKTIVLLTILCSTAFGCASPPQLTNEDAIAIRQRRLEQGSPPPDQLQLTRQQITMQQQINAQAQAQSAAVLQRMQTQQSQQPTPMPTFNLNLPAPQVQSISPSSGNITCIRSGVLTSCEASASPIPPVAPPSTNTITCIDSGPVTNCRY